jgi:putative transposase
MSEYRRVYIPGGTYFFTLVTDHRRPILTTALGRHCLRKAIVQVRKAHPYSLQAIRLLPEHLHCLWSLPDDDADYSGRWNAIKGVFSKACLRAGGTDGRRSASRQRKGEAAIWHRRFWEHAIRDHDDFERLFHYIHYNPVKHGYVDDPAKWPWSSFHRYLRMGWYEQGWGRQEPNVLKGIVCAGE